MISEIYKYDCSKAHLSDHSLYKVTNRKDNTPAVMLTFTFHSYNCVAFIILHDYTIANYRVWIMQMSPKFFLYILENMNIQMIFGFLVNVLINSQTNTEKRHKEDISMFNIN